MPGTRRLVHILMDAPKDAHALKNSLELQDDKTCAIIHSPGTLKLTGKPGEMLVLEATLENPVWLEAAAECLLRHPAVPVIVWSPHFQAPGGLIRLGKAGLLFAGGGGPEMESALLRLDAEEALGRKTVLLVDDDPIVLKAMTRLLRRSPWNVFAVSSAERAMNLLSVENVDVVVTDIKMPEVHGLELVARIRKRFKRMPIVVCSGYPGMRDDPELAIHNISDFFEKPVDPDCFEERIATVIAGCAQSGNT